MINKKIILLLSMFLCSPLLIFCGTGAMAETIDGLSDPGPTPASVSCNVTNNTLLVCNYTDWYPSSWSAQTPVSTGYKFLAVRMQYGSPQAGMVCAREGNGPFLSLPRTVCSNYGFGRYSGSMSAVTVQTDTDGDVRINTYDNCPSTSNTDQLNTDGDAQGDACDTDDDNDGLLDASDNCSFNANPDQLNTDGDAQGDVCDTDDDNDGVVDASDVFPLDNTQAGDIDNDGIDGFVDNCQSIPNADQLNTDGDTQGNACDTDDDNDGVVDAVDKFPLNVAASVDGDLDGVPTNWNAACDVTCQSNSGLVLDNCQSNANADQLNTDGDAQGNACDTDDDNDGVADGIDQCPLDPACTVDADGDGLDNAVDPDDDNDTVLDGSDNCPLTANLNQQDVDSNGKGDVCDLPLTHVKLAAGGSHTCALTTAGGVKCWGYNNYGQLGDNTTIKKLTPVDVIGLDGSVAAIAAGWPHTCALTTAGGVKCWGFNSSGQLGDNTTVNKFTPVDVVGLGSGVVAIAVGNNHTCALTTAGGVKCWGSNSPGQLGDNTTLNKLTPVDVVVGLVSGVVAITAGHYHTCALTTAGGVKCWGDNYYGQLGDNTTVNKFTPVDVVGLGSGIVAITAGYRHTCALTSAGGVKCWGSNPYGQLGDSTTVNKLTPVDVVGLGGGVAEIVAGSWHTCALTAAGGVKCWGYNAAAGQLGDNTMVNKLAPVDVVGLGSGVVSVAAGGDDTCALTTAGGVKCWGSNEYGQIGDNTTFDRLTPVWVIGFTDTDNDGFLDAVDNCPSNANSDQLNTDGDSQGDVCDTDDDNDGVSDGSDKFPLDPTETIDTDNDGIGNNADLDDDGDGVPDYIDAAPLNAANASEVMLPLNSGYQGSIITEQVAPQ